MRRFALLVIGVTLLSGSIARAASYVTTTGTIINPILATSGSPHSYSGNNLKPSAHLSSANLEYANLTGADLYDAYLWQANLSNADLTGADLDTAILLGANLSKADLTGADLDNTILDYAALDDATFSSGTTLKDGQTVLQHAFNAAGLESYLLAWPVSASSASNLTIVVPEPASVLLLLTGLLTLARVRF